MVKRSKGRDLTSNSRRKSETSRNAESPQWRWWDARIAPPTVEELEERIALSLPPELIDINQSRASTASYPLTEYGGNLVYYNADGLPSDPKGLKLSGGNGTVGTSLATSVSNASFGRLNDTIFYQGGPIDDLELYSYNLATSTGGLVSNIYSSGTNPDLYSSLPEMFVASGGQMYFWANSTSGFDIWKTTGTYASTVLAFNITAFSSGSAKEMVFPDSTPVWIVKPIGSVPVLGRGTSLVSGLPAASAIQKLTVGADGGVYFFLQPTSGAWQFYRLNGSTAQLINSSLPGAPSDILSVGSQIYYTIDNSVYSGNYASGFNLVYTGASGSSVQYLTELSGSVYFLESQDAEGSHWTLRDTTGGAIASDVVVGNVPRTRPVVAFNSQLFFAVDRATTGVELYKSDGTALGTVIVADIVGGPTGSRVDGIFAGTTKLFFEADDGSGINGNAFYSTDGTLAGTNRLSSVHRAFNSGSSVSIDVDAEVVVSAVSGNTRNIYVGNGDLASPVQVDVDGLPVDGVVGTIGSRIIYRTPGQVWTTDGLTRTLLLDNVTIRGSLKAGHRIFLLVDPLDVSGSAVWLWATDGTTIGTVQLDPTSASSSSTITGHWLAVGDRLFYRNGAVVGMSDGTVAGSTRFTSTSTLPKLERAVGNIVIWYDGSSDSLWRSDGTPEGTYAFSSGATSYPLVSAVVSNGLYYASRSWVTSAGGLIRSDGTEAGTFVLSINGLPATTITTSFTLGNYLYFFVKQNLYRTDGSPGAPTLVLTLPGSGTASSAVVLGNKAYFQYSTTAAGTELWEVDGGLAAAQLALDVWPGEGSSSATILGIYKDRLLLRADDGLHGAELFDWNVNDAPIPVIEDPSRMLTYGETAIFDATQSFDPVSGSPLFFEWDTDNDGVFDNSTAGVLSLSWSQLLALGVNTTVPTTMRLRVSTPDYRSSVASVSMLIRDGVIAVISGPAKVAAGSGVVFDASSSVDTIAAGPLTYDWDTDNDGYYDDASGAILSLSWSQLLDLGIDTVTPLHIGLRATSVDSRTDVAARTLLVANESPVATIAVPPVVSAFVGQTVSMTLSASDPWPADNAAGFRFLIDWDGNGTTDETVAGPTNNVVVSHAYNTSGNYTIGVRAVDRIGSVGAAATYLVHIYPSDFSRSGSETRINTYTTNVQDSPKIASDGMGNFVVTWHSSGQDGSSYGVYAKRFSGGGAIPPTDVRVNTWTTNSQAASSVAMNANGDYVIVWSSSGQDGSGLGVYGQRFNAAGTSQGGEFRVNTFTTNDQGGPSVAMDGDGNFVVVWYSVGQESSSGANLRGVYGQRFSASGAPLGPEFHVNTYTTSGQDLPRIAMSPGGDFVVAWQSSGQDGNNYGIYAQRFNATGVKVGSEFRVNTTTSGNQNRPKAAMDPSGNFVITWTGPIPGTGSSEVWARRYDAFGTALGDEFRVNAYTTGTQTARWISMGSAGDFVIAFDGVGDSGSTYGVYAKRYDPAGVAMGDEFLINTYVTGNQERVAVALDANGMFVVWQSPQDGSSQGIYGQYYVPSIPYGGPFRVTEGQSLSLNAYDDLDPNSGTYTYGWDLNGDDNFSDATGANPTLTWAELESLGIGDGGVERTIRFRVTKPSGTTTYSSLLSVWSAPPSASISPSVVGRGAATPFLLTAIDPSSADQAANLTFYVDWNGDGVSDETVVGPSGTTVNHTFDVAGVTKIGIRAMDKDGGISAYQAISINVLAYEVVGGELLWYGTTGDDAVSFEQINSSTVVVHETKLNGAVVAIHTTVSGVTGKVTAYGRQGADAVDGSALTNKTLWAYGGAGNDSIAGGAGQDWLQGEDGDDSLTGGAGNDHLDGGAGNDVLQGNGDNDLLVGGAGNDSILGGDGNDIAYGDVIDPPNGFAYGHDTIFGGSDNDTIYGDGDGGEGTSDLLFGEDGDDVIYGDGSVGDKTGLDTIRGGIGNDTIYSDQDGAEGAADSIFGEDGDDLIQTGRGNDWAAGGIGNDIVLGGDGGEGANDVLIGGEGYDILVGDQMTAGSATNAGGADTILGGGGQDILLAGVFTAVDTYTALVAIRGEWTSSRSLAERMANISGTGSGDRLNGDYFLELGVTAFNDQPALPSSALVDLVYGQGDDDWMLVDFGEDVTPDLGGGDVAIDVHGYPKP